MYVDAPFGGENLWSQNEALVFLSGQLVMWNSGRQDVVTQPITEAEYTRKQ